jgi:hypothetical protein
MGSWSPRSANGKTTPRVLVSRKDLQHPLIDRHSDLVIGLGEGEERKHVNRTSQKRDFLTAFGPTHQAVNGEIKGLYQR